MMILMLGEMILEGIVLAALWLLLVNRVTERRRVAAHALMLVIAAAIYVLFALAANQHAGLYIELGGTALFASLATYGLRRRSMALLGLAWALHPIWDVGLHFGVFPGVDGPGTYASIGYVVACIGFDWFLAVRLMRAQREVASHGVREGHGVNTRASANTA